MTRLLCLVAAILLPGAVPVGGAAEVRQADPDPAPHVRIPAGSYTPAFAAPGAPPVQVEAFILDAHPVTVAEYLTFVETHPRWRRSALPRVAGGSGYLASWRTDLNPGVTGSALRRPITGVSWFAASAYCEAQGARLPSTREWEYAASKVAGGRPGPATVMSGPLPHGFTPALRALQARRGARAELPPVGRTWVSDHGVWDLHGVVWEWTSDFNSRLATGAGRDDQGLDRQLFCAAGSTGATDRGDYVAFLRFAFRTSLVGADAGPELGFRCAH